MYGYGFPKSLLIQAKIKSRDSPADQLFAMAENNLRAKRKARAIVARAAAPRKSAASYSIGGTRPRCGHERSPEPQEQPGKHRDEKDIGSNSLNIVCGQRAHQTE